MEQVWRVLDANGNRAAEGLRVLEEVARFVRDDARYAAILKQLRHELAEALALLNRQDRLASRSTATDVGTSITVAHERERVDISSLVSAEASRVGESLRSLEEFSKLHDAEISSRFKQLRYRAYDQLARMELAWTRHAWLASMRLCVLIDCALPIDAFAAYIRKLAEAGLHCLQIRDKRLEGAALVRYARCAVQTVTPIGCHVIVNDRVDIALASGAAGVHVGQDDMPMEDVRRIAGGRLCIGVSTHDIQQARDAVARGADYIGCGPTFPSSTKSFDQFAGVAFLQQVAQEITIPCLAIGGVSLENISQVISSGVRVAAVSAAVHQATQPHEAVRQLVKRLEQGQ